jgi:hypothetical protein
MLICVSERESRGSGAIAELRVIPVVALEPAG